MFRIPPSLSWLINKRARLLGEINAARKNLNEYITAEEERIALLEASLINLDGTIKLHEIQIDPNLISAKRVNNAKKYLPHGGYTKLILDSLRQAYPNPIGTDDLTLILMKVINNPELTFEELRPIFKQRLKEISRKGMIIAVHKDRPAWNAKGLWKLNPDSIPNPKKVVNSELASSFAPLPITLPPD
jgi:hypothetical protein